MNDKAGQLQSINPHDNSVVATYDEHNDKEVDAILDAVVDCQIGWGRQGMEARTRTLLSLAQGLRDNVDDYARLMTVEMGKPIKQAKAEIEKCAWVSEYYAENAARFLQDQQIESNAKQSTVVFRPLGVVFAIMPWNFPFWQAFRFAVPAIAAGNAVVLKHASNVTGCAMAIEEVFNNHVNKDILRTLVMRARRASALIADNRIRAVTFTGSTEAGASVGEAAGKSLKKTVLELGGSDPYVVLADADIDQAAKTCAAARLVNTGQSCIAAKRFIVENDVHDAFLEALCKHMGDFKLGDPMQEETDLGPMAREDLAEELHTQVERSATAGARRVIGGGRPPEGGAYYPATVLADVEPGMPAFDEEMFGPVAAVIRADNAGHAMDLANDSRFGLGGAIFTADEDKGFELAADVMETGTIAINGQVQSDPRLPFGGVKESGYGRELGEFGIREFVNIKTVSRF